MAQVKASTTTRLPFTGSSPAYRAFRQRLMELGAPLTYPEPARHSPYAHLWICPVYNQHVSAECYRYVVGNACTCGALAMPEPVQEEAA